MQLSPEQIEFYAAMEYTFSTKGWALMRRRWKEEQDQLLDRCFFSAKNMEDVNEHRGRYELLNELLTLPDHLAKQKEHIELSDDPEGS